MDRTMRWRRGRRWCGGLKIRVAAICKRDRVETGGTEGGVYSNFTNCIIATMTFQFENHHLPEFMLHQIKTATRKIVAVK